MRMRSVIEDSIELFFSSLYLFVPFLVGLAGMIIIGIVHKALEQTASTYQLAGTVVLALCGLIILLVTYNWGMFVISRAVKTKKVTLEGTFESSFPYLLRFILIKGSLGLIMGLFYLLYLYLNNINAFLGGIGLVLLLLVVLVLLFTFGLAKEIMYYKNATFVQAINTSRKVLMHNGLHFLTLLFIFLLVGGILLGIGVLSNYLGPFGMLALLIATFMYAIWIQIALFIFYRQSRLKKI